MTVDNKLSIASADESGEMMSANEYNKAGENLARQVDAAFRANHEKSKNTRYKYWDAANRFARFTGETFGLKNIRNIDDRHIQAYVNELLDNDSKISYIKTELSAIRHLHHIVDGKRPIHPKNDYFGIGRRETIIQRYATEEEYQNARQLALKIGQPLIARAIEYMYNFGNRNNEAHAFRCERVEHAIEKQVYILSQQDGTKGGRYREIPVETDEQRELLKQTLEDILKSGKTKSDRVLTGRESGAVHKQKAKVARFFSYYKDILGNISAHSLRRAFSQGVYDRTPGTDAERMARVCELLGHGPDREDITARYVPNRHAR